METILWTCRAAGNIHVGPIHGKGTAQLTGIAWGMGHGA
ncbi:hypothetical protein MSKU9_0617 [Komagataeibacter diospyri]|uniref:Uncharacterized protein n=1 Tax=Komagataeibacter diospyri TaxID=1932662 RepID=A0A4P5NX42_9PROT|nr:hypothetical protein MSKU9_0617 [Komagataeibacter diospyri]